MRLACTLHVNVHGLHHILPVLITPWMNVSTGNASNMVTIEMDVSKMMAGMPIEWKPDSKMSTPRVYVKPYAAWKFGEMDAAYSS